MPAPHQRTLLRPPEHQSLEPRLIYRVRERHTCNCLDLKHSKMLPSKDFQGPSKEPGERACHLLWKAFPKNNMHLNRDHQRRKSGIVTLRSSTIGHEKEKVTKSTSDSMSLIVGLLIKLLYLRAKWSISDGSIQTLMY
jgi:hypothetical protein